MKKILLKIDGMSCSACSNTLEKHLNKQEGIEATVNLVMSSALVKYDSKKYKIEDIENIIEQVGFKSLGEYKTLNDNKKNHDKLFLIIYLFLLIIMMYLMLSNMFNVLKLSFINPIIYGLIMFIMSIPFIIYGFDILKSGVLKLIHRRPNMDSLVTLSVISSFIYSFINLILMIFGNKTLINYLYFESVAMIIYFVKLGKYIDKKNKEKTRKAIEELVTITPDFAYKKDGENIKKVTIDEVKKGDILVCKPGNKIAVDGVITKGLSHFNESFITGESKLVKKTVKDNVIAGSINIDGLIEYKALKIGKDSMISEIVRLVNESMNSKMHFERITDKICGMFVPFVIAISLIGFITYLIMGKSFNEALITFVTVLVVACPCALGLATPITVVVANGVCAKLGILVKSSEILEITSKVKKIVFDKTGTLTYGDLRISRLANYSSYGNEKLLNIVASLEVNSNHPISSAFKSYNPKYEVSEFRNIEGIGITGIIGRRTFYVGNYKLLNDLDIENSYEEIEDNFKSLGNTILYVIENKKIIGLIGVKDIVRKNTKKVISSLKDMNLDVYLFTGDNIETAGIIANSLNIDNVRANLLPKDKLNFLNELKEDNLTLMVGDGINDAPALTSANVGVSIGSASDISKNSSDVIILSNNLERIVDLIKISKKAIKIIKENLLLAFFYNLIMILIALGLFKKYGISLNPVIASICMTLSSLTVVGNSLRLKNYTKSKKNNKKNKQN